MPKLLANSHPYGVKHLKVTVRQDSALLWAPGGAPGADLKTRLRGNGIEDVLYGVIGIFSDL